MKKVCIAILCLFVSVIGTNKILFANNQANNTKLDNTKKTINVAMLLPLFYDNINELSFNEYNIDERRSRKYKCFSYISFYEGARIALDNLEKQGYKISLYVFDVGEDNTQKMQEALNYPTMRQMDLIITLVFKNSFALASNFCQINKIPLINPMSQDNSILSNPYVFKIQPDDLSASISLTKYIKQEKSSSKIIVLYNDRNISRTLLNYWKETLPTLTDKWTVMNFKKNAAKINKYLAQQGENIVIDLSDNNSSLENKSYALSVMNTLRKSKCNITLFAQYDWINYIGNDYKILEDLNFHFSIPYYNDYSNENFTNFVHLYRENFKTEPDKIYSSIGYDLVTYFLPLIKSFGKDFILSPTNTNQKDMIIRYKFIRENDSKGWLNTNAIIYRLKNYKIKSQWSL